MEPLSLLLFVVISFSLGYPIVHFLPKIENKYERFFIALGLGLSFIILIGVIFSLCKIPIDWKYFLAVGVVMLAAILYIKHKKKELNFKNPFAEITGYDIKIFIVILIMILSLFMYTKGSFSYTYLEDDDPWEHALGVSYVSHEKKITEPEGTDVIHYLDPYPPDLI